MKKSKCIVDGGRKLPVAEKRYACVRFRLRFKYADGTTWDGEFEEGGERAAAQTVTAALGSTGAGTFVWAEDPSGRLVFGERPERLRETP